MRLGLAEVRLGLDQAWLRSGLAQARLGSG